MLIEASEPVVEARVDPVVETTVESTVEPAVEPVVRAAPTTPSLSPSRAGDFMTCPLLYRFRVLDRLPEPPSQAATRGTVVHSVLEQLFDLPAAERTLARANTIVDQVWRELLEGDDVLAELVAGDIHNQQDTDWLAGTDSLLATYFGLEDPTRLEPAEREFGVEVDLSSGLRLRGYIDRLDVAPDGAMRIVDYKTGRAPGVAFEQRAMFQMRFYALVLWRLRGEVPRMLQLVYLGSGEVIRYEPDEADLLATERKLDALWAAIARSYEQGEWRANKSKLCDWCHHKPLCPAWGGTPPPLPVNPVTAVAGIADRPAVNTTVIDV